jgi:hypothetical protein
LGSTTATGAAETGTSNEVVAKSDQWTVNASSFECDPTPISIGSACTMRLVRQLPALTSIRMPSALAFDRVPVR